MPWAAGSRRPRDRGKARKRGAGSTLRPEGYPWQTLLPPSTATGLNPFARPLRQNVPESRGRETARVTDDSEHPDATAPAPPTPPGADPWLLPVNAGDIATTLPAAPGRAAPPRATTPARVEAPREADLAALASMLDDFGAAVIAETPAVGGRGGVGKTWLALAHGRRHHSAYPGGVFRVPAADPDAVPAAIAACGLRAGVATRGSLDARIEATFRAWESGPPSLVILDDCRDPEVVRAWRPEGRARLLVTTRHGSWAGALGLPAHHLEALDDAAGLALLRGFRPDLRADDPDLGRIVELLRHLPQALVLAGRTLRHARETAAGTPAAYLASLRAIQAEQTLLEIDGLRRAPLGPELPTLRAAILATAQLRDMHGPDIIAKATLRLAARFAPGAPIPAWLLNRCAEAYEAPPDDWLIEKAVGRLAALGLLQRESGSGPDVAVPPLVAALTVAMNPDKTAAARDLVEGVAARAALAAAEEGRVDDLLVWETQLHHLATAAETRAGGTAGLLLRALALHHDRLDDPGEADWLRERARAADAASGGLRLPPAPPDPRSPAETFTRRERSQAEQQRFTERQDQAAAPPARRTRR